MTVTRMTRSTLDQFAFECLGRKVTLSACWLERLAVTAAAHHDIDMARLLLTCAHLPAAALVALRPLRHHKVRSLLLAHPNLPRQVCAELFAGERRVSVLDEAFLIASPQLVRVAAAHPPRPDDTRLAERVLWRMFHPPAVTIGRTVIRRRPIRDPAVVRRFLPAADTPTRSMVCHQLAAHALVRPGIDPEARDLCLRLVAPGEVPALWPLLAEHDADAVVAANPLLVSLHEHIFRVFRDDHDRAVRVYADARANSDYGLTVLAALAGDTDAFTTSDLTHYSRNTAVAELVDGLVTSLTPDAYQSFAALSDSWPGTLAELAAATRKL